MPRKEFPVTGEDTMKANILLVAIISLYFLLVLISFACTDGRRRYIIPLLRYDPSFSLIDVTIIRRPAEGGPVQQRGTSPKNFPPKNFCRLKVKTYSVA